MRRLGNAMDDTINGTPDFLEGLRKSLPTLGREQVNAAIRRWIDPRALRRSMQVVFQDPFGSLSPRMAAGDIVAEGVIETEQAQPAAPKKPEKKLQAKRRIAKRHVAPPMMLVAQQPAFGFFGNITR